MQVFFNAVGFCSKSLYFLVDNKNTYQIKVPHHPYLDTNILILRSTIDVLLCNNYCAQTSSVKLLLSKQQLVTIEITITMFQVSKDGRLVGSIGHNVEARYVEDIEQSAKMAGWMSKVVLTNRLPDFSKLPGESPLSSSSTEVEVNSRLLSASEVTHKLLVAVNMSFQTGVAFQFQVKQFISFLPCF